MTTRTIAEDGSLKLFVKAVQCSSEESMPSPVEVAAFQRKVTPCAGRKRHLQSPVPDGPAGFEVTLATIE